MNNVLIFMIIVALLVSFIAGPISSGPSDSGKGHSMPGQGLGKGHTNHDCDDTCSICGGNPCVPPCPGV